MYSDLQPWDKEELSKRVVLDENYGNVKEEFSSSIANSDDFVYLPNDNK